MSVPGLVASGLASLLAITAWDALKRAYREATRRSWADLVLDAWASVVQNMREALQRYGDGEAQPDRDALKRALDAVGMSVADLGRDINRYEARGSPGALSQSESGAGSIVADMDPLLRSSRQSAP
jgi:hypothetical protein